MQLASNVIELRGFLSYILKTFGLEEFRHEIERNFLKLICRCLGNVVVNLYLHPVIA